MGQGALGISSPATHAPWGETQHLRPQTPTRSPAEWSAAPQSAAESGSEQAGVSGRAVKAPAERTAVSLTMGGQAGVGPREANPFLSKSCQVWGLEGAPQRHAHTDPGTHTRPHSRRGLCS